MKPAPEFQLIRPGLAFWQAYDPSVKTDLSCCALDTPGGVIFIDPVPLAADALEELLAGRPPRAILLTSANHERASGALAARFQIEIWAHEEARDHIPATQWFGGEDPLFDFILPIPLPGFAPGECAFLAGDLLILGDALVHLPGYGFSFLPDKYCSNPKLARQSLKNLLDLPVEILLFAHGLPIVSHAAGRLAALIG